MNVNVMNPKLIAIAVAVIVVIAVAIALYMHKRKKNTAGLRDRLRGARSVRRPGESRSRFRNSRLKIAIDHPLILRWA